MIHRVVTHVFTTSCSRVCLPAIHCKMTQNMFSTEPIKPSKEFNIPVPWGHIAAKAWGDENGCPVLGVHGYLDNANTFARLASYLPSDLYFVCIDWPGHGFSSHRPPGMLYYHPDYVMDIKRVTSALGWKKFSIIGHSLGAGVAFMFASAFQDLVDKLVLIENLTPFPRSPEGHGERFSRSFQQLVRIEAFRKEDEVYYSKQDLIDIYKVGHEWCTEDSAKILMERAVKPVDTSEGVKFSFTRDPRLKVTSPISYTPEELSSCSMRLRCEVLFIVANDGFGSKSFPGKEFAEKCVQQQCKIVQQVCKKFVMVDVEGNHHTHLNTPQHVAPHIVSFMAKDQVCVEGQKL